MKKVAFLIFIFSSLNTVGQEIINIEIDNPEPRVGQDVLISINVDFLRDYLEKELGNNIELTGSKNIFGMSSDKLKWEIEFKKAKKYKIGPLDFKFNGKRFTTNTIEVNVIPRLPYENGLWLRLTEFQGDKYLILEQLIQNESNRTVNENGGNTRTVGGVKPEGREFAELKEELTTGIELSNYGSSQYNLKSEDAGSLDVGFSYSIKKYKVNFEDSSPGNYLITIKDFQNLPDKYSIEGVNLKK